ncbi:hypothetical protein Tco_1028588 [Tanacetum coccineum]|uniref:Uncharacterized protein n=1 Tax=Tanacetum coccineum TaxID=301880 RepID=A0ABQ5G137_9ASTR
MAANLQDKADAHVLVSEPKFLIKMPARRNRDINDIYEQELEQQDVGINSRRSKGEESENPFFKGDGSSLFVEHKEWEDDGVSDDDYEEALVFDVDQYKDVIKEEEGFIDNYLNFQKDETNVSFSGVVLGVEEESMPVYDTDIEDVIEDEEGFVRERGFCEEENNMKDVVVVANDLFSSKIQTLVSEPKFLIKIPPRRSKGEESENPFFKGDGSSLFVEHKEWEDDGVSDDDYEEAPVFDVDQYEDVIEEEEGFIDNYPNFQKDETNVSFSGVVLGVEEESMPVYDTDIEDVIEHEEGFIRERGFGKEENNMEDVVVVANDLFSSKI